MHTQPVDRAAYELHFASMFNAGRALAFPCDAKGQVNIDLLGKKAVANYLYARALVGREFLTPSVRITEESRRNATRDTW